MVRDESRAFEFGAQHIAPPVELAIHDLGTTSIKFGALSDNDPQMALEIAGCA